PRSTLHEFSRATVTRSPPPIFHAFGFAKQRWSVSRAMSAEIEYSFSWTEPLAILSRSCIPVVALHRFTVRVEMVRRQICSQRRGAVLVPLRGSRLLARRG